MLLAPLPEGCARGHPHPPFTTPFSHSKIHCPEVCFRVGPGVHGFLWGRTKIRLKIRPTIRLTIRPKIRPKIRRLLREDFVAIYICVCCQVLLRQLTALRVFSKQLARISHDDGLEVVGDRMDSRRMRGICMCGRSLARSRSKLVEP